MLRTNSIKSTNVVSRIAEARSVTIDDIKINILSANSATISDLKQLGSIESAELQVNSGQTFMNQPRVNIEFSGSGQSDGLISDLVTSEVIIEDIVVADISLEQLNLNNLSTSSSEELSISNIASLTADITLSQIETLSTVQCTLPETTSALSAEIINTTTSDANIGTVNVNAPVFEGALAVDALETSVLNVNVLNTTDATISNIFANQIGSLAQVDVTETVIVRETASSNKALLQGLLIAAFIVAAIALTVLTYGAGSAVFACAAPGITATSYILGGGSVIGCCMAAATVSATFASTMTVAAVTLGTSLVASGVFIGAILDQPSLPSVKPIAMNASYGKSFLSDIIFGTTSYYSHAAGYTSYMLIQNQNNSSYALPRILSYNPPLFSFDDSNYYGNSIAYMSLATGQPNTHTLRFQANGNLAIYDTSSTNPIWSSGTQVSSRKHKENIKKIENARRKLKTLDGIRYTCRGQRTVGLIAQQLKEVLPEAVYGDEENGYRVRLERTIPLIIEAMKEIYWKQEEMLKMT